MIRVDYHFHPNLPLFSRRLTEWKAKQIWQNLAYHKLDVVLIAEHVFKKPRTSFEVLRFYRPGGCKTYLIPGIECTSREGVDLIAFSQDPRKIYGEKELLIPYYLSVEKLIGHIQEDKDLYGIVVHPETPGTGMVKICGLAATLRAIDNLGFLEKYNASITELIGLFEKIGLKEIFRKKYFQLLQIQTAPTYLEEKARIATVGSDAHHVCGLGDYLGIDAIYKNDEDYLFEVIVSQPGRFSLKKKPSFFCSFPSVLTFLSEVVRRRLKWYSVDEPLK